MRAGRLQARVRAGIRLRDSRGWGRAARSTVYSEDSGDTAPGELRNGDRIAIHERRWTAYGILTRAGDRVFPGDAAADIGEDGARSDFGICGRESDGARAVQQEFSAGVSRDRSAGGVAAQAIQIRGSAMQDASEAYGPHDDNRGAIAVLSDSRATWRFREHPQVRREEKVKHGTVAERHHGFQRASDRAGAGVGQARAHPAGVFGELADGRAGAAGSVALAFAARPGRRLARVDGSGAGIFAGGGRGVPNRVVSIFSDHV